MKILEFIKEKASVKSIICAIVLGAIGAVFLKLPGFLIGAAIGFFAGSLILSKIGQKMSEGDSDKVDILATPDDEEDEEPGDLPDDELLNAAEAGDPDAQYRVADTYYRAPEGFIKDKDGETVRWYQKAADNGHTAAQYSLGVIYGEGRCGVTKNLYKAFELFEKAANKGDVDSYYSLAMAYCNGEGVAQNPEKAFEWMKKFSEIVKPDDSLCNSAWYNLGVLYEEGTGTEKDLNKAREWYGKAAANGFEEAQEALKQLG